MNARKYTTRSGAERALAAINLATDSGRPFTQADVDSGLVEFVGECHTRVEDIAIRNWCEIVERDGSFYLPWSPKLSRHTHKPGVPDGPNATLPVVAVEIG